MDTLGTWKKVAGHALILIAIASLAYFSVRTEMSLARRGVQLMPLDSVPQSD